jgi:O-antigen/teichoic acid export membrane protein
MSIQPTIAAQAAEPVNGVAEPPPAPPAPDAAAPRDAAPPRSGDSSSHPTLRSLAISATFWTLVSHGAGQLLRLISNVCLTWLLVPEIFGVMGLVQVLVTALNMFSDAGLNAGVVYHKRGDDPDFVDTAWTMQVFRGGLLWLATCVIAWPAAVFYEQPMLLWLLPIVGATSLIAGFRSTAGFILTRRVIVKPLVWRHITAQAVSLVVMLIVSIWTRSVWVLVVGQFITTILDVLLSFTVTKEGRPRFHWDRDAVRDLYRFGRWIFVGTAITFLLQHGDRAVLGKLISEAELGVYVIAALLARVPIEILLRLTAQVLFPIYARSAHESRERLIHRLVKARVGVLAALLPMTCAISIAGPFLVELLYRDAYHEAGWMLRILAIGASMTVINISAAGAILAVGDSFQHMINQVARGVLLIAGMWIGWHFGQLSGLLIGMTISKVLEYPVIAIGLARHRLWLPAVDFAAMAIAAAVTAIGIWLVG